MTHDTSAPNPSPSGVTRGLQSRRERVAQLVGLESARPARVEEPADTAAIVAAVERARAEGSTVKMVGTGHSFTAISAPEHTMLRPDPARRDPRRSTATR